jgi:hypothetical protein
MDGLGIHIDRFVTLREHAQNPRECDTKQHLERFGEFARIMQGNAIPLLHGKRQFGYGRAFLACVKGNEGLGLLLE